MTSPSGSATRRRLGRLGDRLLGQSGRQGRHRSCRPGRQGRSTPPPIRATPCRSCGGGRRRRPGSSSCAANTPTSGRQPERDVDADRRTPCAGPAAFSCVAGNRRLARQKNMNGARHDERGRRSRERLRGFRQFPRGRPRQRHHQGRRVLLLPWPVGLRQDDDPAHDLRLHRSERRRDQDRRPGHARHPARTSGRPR